MNANYKHIHIMGAPGAGTTTIARQIAMEHGIVHLDSDDYHWFTNDPEPYRRRRNPEHRRALLSADLASNESWVLSGSLCGWGDCYAPLFDLVLLCNADTETRLERIRKRELARYGEERLLPGGDLHLVFNKFLDWAASYETDMIRMRSLAFEKKWLEDHCNCKVICVDTTTEKKIDFFLVT